MRPSVVFVGWSPPPIVIARRWRSVPVARLAAESGPTAPGWIGVLGDRALRELDPVRVASHLRGRTALCLAASSGSDAPLVAAWARRTTVEFVRPDRLVDRIVELEGRGLRASVEPAAWLPRHALSQPDACHAASILDRLEAPGPSAWAAALGISRFRLARSARVWFGMSPQEACRRFTCAVVSTERGRGRTMDAIAALCGYSDAGTLRRALRTAARQRGIEVAGGVRGTTGADGDRSRTPALRPAVEVDPE